MMTELWRSLPWWGKALLVLAILAILGVLVYFIVKFIVLIVVLVAIGIWILYQLGWLTRTNHRKGRYRQEDNPQNAAQYELQYRAKYPALYRATDGHNVRSQPELLIDNWLRTMGIPHDYEKKVPVEENLLCDFYIEQGDVYIEYWGLSNPEYLRHSQWKRKIYKKYGFKLIQLYYKDILTLDDVLPRKLREFGINTK